MSDPVISVRNLSKCYQVFENQCARLRHLFLPSTSRGMSEVWALKDIHFEVVHGESVGIIGRNGSGKSTLLEIIAGTLAPTSGEAQVKGRVAALLELGSGFNPEYSGRENVFLNGLLLGLTRSQIERRFDDIAGFADIGDVLERPVKTYSSGMLVRLAFAVQVALDPEILIVDEALSVGDFFFQQKCFGRLRHMRDSGLTLLFVSHDLSTVRDLCSRAVYLREGRAVFIGDSKQAIREYLAEQSSIVFPHVAPVRSADTAAPTEGNLTLIRQTALWSAEAGHETNRRLLAVRIMDLKGYPITSARMADTIRLQVFFRTTEKESGHISFCIKNRFDHIVASTGTYLLGERECSSGKAPFEGIEFEIRLMLEAGLYSLLVSFVKPTQVNQGVVLDRSGWIGPIQITWDFETQRAPFLGLFGLPVQIRRYLYHEEANS